MTKQEQILQKAKEALEFLKGVSDVKSYNLPGDLTELTDGKQTYIPFHKVTFEATVDGADLKLELVGDD